MREDDKQFDGNELDDSLPEKSEEITDPETLESTSGSIVEKASGRKGRKVLLAVVGLFVVAFVSYIIGNKFIPNNQKVPIVMRVPIEQDQLTEIKSFIIPHSGGSYNFISFSVSLRIAKSEAKKEIKMKRQYLRGKIYDLLETLVNQQVHIPSLENVKDIVETCVNDTLSEGKIDGVYITHFLVI